MVTWKQYEEDVASFFRSLGYEARANVTVEGARGRHDVDVLVSFRAVGQTVTWVIECKQWERPVPKERVLILDSVVKDVGADRGILVAESGYQAGAIRIAERTNITLTSLVDLRENAEEERARLQNQLYISRIATVGRRFSRLWLWTQPQIRRPVFQMSDLLERGLTGFELQLLVLPRLAANTFPITIGYGSRRVIARTAAELDDTLAVALTKAEQELFLFERAVAEQTVNAYAALDRLTSAVGRLLDTGRLLSISTDDTGLGEAFVAAMREISDAASDLREGAPDPVARQVVELMHHLIHGTYVITNSVIPDWDLEEQALQGLLAMLASQLDSVAIHPPREQAGDSSDI